VEKPQSPVPGPNPATSPPQVLALSRNSLVLPLFGIFQIPLADGLGESMQQWADQSIHQRSSVKAGWWHLNFLDRVACLSWVLT
jgi:hypothetical protein